MAGHLHHRRECFTPCDSPRSSQCAEILVANDRGTDVDTGEHISSIELKTDSGFTALHLSVSGTAEDALQITRYLVLCGANRFAEDSLGRTPARGARPGASFRS